MTWDDRDDSPSQRSRSSRRTSLPFLPLVLIAIGLSVILDRIVGGGFSAWELFWLAAGIWCLARARDDGPYPLLVIGAFLVGNNVGELIGTLISRGVADATETLGTAAAFLWLYATDRPRSRWAIFVAVIAGFIGLAELGNEITELAGEGDSWILPAGVIVAGVLLLGAHRLPGPIRLGGFLFVGVAILSLLGNDDDGRRRDAIPTGQPVTTVGPRAFELQSRLLRIEGDNGPVIVEEGDATVLSGRILNETPDEVVVQPVRGNGPVHVRVPRGTALDIEVDNGAVSVTSPTANAEITTNNGPILFHVLGEPEIDAESDNAQVIAFGEPEGGAYAEGGDDGEVELASDNGVITIMRAPEPAGAGLR